MNKNCKICDAVYDNKNESSMNIKKLCEKCRSFYITVLNRIGFLKNELKFMKMDRDELKDQLYTSCIGYIPNLFENT